MALALFCAMLPALFYIQSAVGARSEPSKTIVALRKYTVKVHEKVPRCQRKLVVRVGLHKTGTTSIQQFLDNHRTFLAKKMNVNVGDPGEAYRCVPALILQMRKFGSVDAAFQSLPPSDFLRKYCNRSGFTFNDTLRFTVSAFSDKRTETVIISQEVFWMFTDSEWGLFERLLRNEFRKMNEDMSQPVDTGLAPSAQCFAIEPVLFIRNPTAWFRSFWVQRLKTHNVCVGRCDIKQGFWQFFTQRKDLRNATERAYKTLSRRFERVHVVSYDYLRQSRLSLQSFVICNATLGKQGKTWENCRQSVDAHKIVRANENPTSMVADVVRLALQIYEKHAKPSCTDRFVLDLRSPRIKCIAQIMPKSCYNIDAFFTKQLDAFFTKTHALRPRTQKEMICLIDMRVWNTSHFQYITKLLPECVGQIDPAIDIVKLGLPSNDPPEGAQEVIPQRSSMPLLDCERWL